MSDPYVRYTVEDGDGADQMVVFEQSEYAQARDLAIEIQGVVIAQEYQWSDSDIVDDFRPNLDDDEEDAWAH